MITKKNKNRYAVRLLKTDEPFTLEDYDVMMNKKYKGNEIWGVIEQGKYQTILAKFADRIDNPYSAKKSMRVDRVYYSVEEMENDFRGNRF